MFMEELSSFSSERTRFENIWGSTDSGEREMVRGYLSCRQDITGEGSDASLQQEWHPSCQEGFALRLGSRT